MRIIVLGSAAGGGLPQWNCGCEWCGRARAGDPAVPQRTQSSIAVSADGERWVLFNASPDLRTQLIAIPALHPCDGARGSPLAAVVLTNADVDHVGGLLTLRERQAFALYASSRVLAVLSGNSVYGVLNPALVDRRVLPLGAAQEVADAEDVPLGLSVEAYPVPGKVPLYLEDEAAGTDFGTLPEDVVGLCIRSQRDGALFHYIPGCACITDDLADRLRGAPLVLFDGTLWRDDEMIRAGLGSKTGRRMGHISLSGPDGSMAALDELGIRRVVFTHINNSNPIVASDSAEHRAVLAAGFEVAHDGMEIIL